MYEDRIAFLQSPAGIAEYGAPRCAELIETLLAWQKAAVLRDAAKQADDQLRDQRSRIRIPEWRQSY